MNRFSQEKHDESQEQESGHDILTNQCFFRCDAKKTFILEKHRMVTNFANITFNSSFKNRQFHVNQFYKSLHTLN